MIDAHALSAGRPPIDQRSALRQKAVTRILGVKPRFHGVPAPLQVVLLKRQLFARRGAQLPRHQIKPCDHFGHRMLDLKPRVHFEEVEFSGTVEQKLDGAGADIVDGARGGDRRLAHLRPQLRRDGRRRRLLDDFLMPALYRAVALAKMDQVTVLVGEDLKLDVAGVGDGAFEDQFVRTEGARRFRARPR